MANNTKTVGELTFIASTDVKVFPCSYRGHVTISTTGNNNDRVDNRKIFDPEARGLTEKNYSHIYGAVSESKESYVISWKDNILKCAINGYYFEISNIESSLFDNDKKLIIKLEEISLGDIENHEYKTTILAPLHDNFHDYLDGKLDPDNDNYYFVGIAIAPSDYPSTNYDNSLTPFIAGEINWSKKRITDFLDTGSAVNSVRMLGNGVEANACTASNDYAFAIGEKTIASGKHALAVGYNTKATAENSVAFGDSSESNHVNAIAAGEGTKTSTDNQVVIGQYNKDNEDALLIIGNGSSESKANKLTVSKDGDIWAKGKVEIEGGLIKATTKTTNLLQLGKSGNNNSGAIDVYGTGNSKVFELTNDGTTYIENTLTTNNYAKIDNKTIGTTDVKPGLTVKGKIVAEKGKNNTLTLGSKDTNDFGAIDVYGRQDKAVFTVSNEGAVYTASSLTVDGTTSLNDNLTVADNKLTSLGGALDVYGETAIVNTLTVSENYKTTLGGDLETTGDTSLSGSLTVTGATTLNDSLTVANGKTTSLGGDLEVTGKTTLTDAVEIKNSLTVTEGKNTVLGGSLEVTDNTTLNGNLTVADDMDTLLGNDLQVKGNTSLDKDLAVTGNTEISGELTVAEDTTINGELTIADGKDTYLGNDLEVKGSTNIIGNLWAGNTELGNLNKVGKIIGSDNWSTTGSMEASSYNATSDARLKTNIKPFTPSNSILDLPVVEYDFITSGKHAIGCLAQDLQKICPEIVHEDSTGWLTIEESKIVYLLIDEVKKLKEEIKSLKGE